MINRFLPLALFAFLAPALTSHAEGYSYKEPISRLAEFHPDGVLAIENVNGEIEIRSWNRNEIQIEGEKSAATEEELRQIDLTMTVTPTRTKIIVKLPNRTGSWFHHNTIRANVRFTISLPATARIDRASTVNSGLSIRGMRGALRATTVNGPIVASEIGSDAELETVNGAITAELAKVDDQAKFSAKTVNGGVKVRVPENTGGTLHASTVNGGIHCALPLEGSSIGRHHVSGRIGSGNADFTIETVNGGVTFERR